MLDSTPQQSSDAVRRGFATLVLIALGLGAAGGAAAIQLAPQAGAYEVDLPARQSVYLDRAEEIAASVEARAMSAVIREELGSGWVVRCWNQYAGTVHAAHGPGVRLAPGGLDGGGGEEIERLAREFIAAHPRLFGTDGRDLRLRRVEHGANRWGVVFEQVAGEIPILNTAVVLAIDEQGRLISIGADVYRQIDVSLQPTLALEHARAVARSVLPFDAGVDFTPGPDALVILPLHRAPGVVEFRLAHRTDVPTSSPPGLWRTYVDAHDGEIVYRTNEVHPVYSGNSQGDAEIISYCDGDTPDLPTANMYVTIDGIGTTTTDEQGDFSIAGGSGPRTFHAQFDGPDFDVDCIFCGGDATMTGVVHPDTPASIYWGAGSVRADERDAFYYTNATKQFIRTLDPSFPLPKYTVDVSVDMFCNAYSSWSDRIMRFGREGGGCANAARILSVVAHEYGHAIQGLLMGGGAQGLEGLGEGNADITSNYMTDTSVVGVGFLLNMCEEGLRDCDNDLVYPDDVIGQPEHISGGVICGFNWDVWQNLVPVMGAAGAKAYSAYLWHFSRMLYGHPGWTQPDQVYYYFVVDDDDGDLTNGTPHWNQICSAAERHGFECTPGPTTAVWYGGAGAPVRLALGEACPNPLNPATEIRYELPAADVVRLAIYDVQGRLVRGLVRELQARGEHVVHWDGRDQGGGAVASGVYFYQLQVGGWSDARALVIVR